MDDAVITATEANRSFARLLRRVKDGQRVRITSHGETVAVLSPPEDERAERERRRASMLAWVESLERQPIIRIEPWTRDELYERESWKKWER